MKRGDALFLIGKKFGITVSQIKAVNGLKDDKIRAGQMLKIPTLTEISAMPNLPTKKKPAETPESKVSPETSIESDRLRLQIFLDREQFSAGPIVRNRDRPLREYYFFIKAPMKMRRMTPPCWQKPKQPCPTSSLTTSLKRTTFDSSCHPRAETVEAKPAPVVAGSVAAHPPTAKPVSRLPAITVAPQTYKELAAMSMLAYRTPWEFVAERFHCRQSYLRTLNEKLPATPGIGAEFRVPNVIPFEIEKTFDETASTSGRSQKSGHSRCDWSVTIEYLSGRRSGRGSALVSRPSRSARQKFLDDS